MRYRQIHLDFHTSGLIPGVGSAFDADAFARAYKAAHVDSITLFAKCHHGFSYHPTEVGRQHPTLGFDLTGAQLQALHRVGIRAPLYLSATWDELAADEHPGWVIVSPDGTLPTFRPPYGHASGWLYLDYASPYLDYLCRQLREVLARYPDCDGIFMDISRQPPSVSAHARRRMTAAGLDWTRAADRQRFNAIVTEEYFQRTKDIVRAHDPKMPLFFNSGHIVKGAKEHYRKFYTHLEIESLPTAAWGYDHFPSSARYAETTGLPMLGMTGKFHYLWGEVGGYKTPAALLYECAAMVAHGARCSIGDHLHPTGAVDPATIQNITPAYEWVAQHQPWLEGSENVAEIALLASEAMQDQAGQAGNSFPGDDGAVRVLLEDRFTFDIVDAAADISAYRLVILPDRIALDQALTAKLTAFLAAGGRLLLTGKSGIDAENGPVFDIGAEWQGASAFTDGDFILPVPDLQASFVGSPLYGYCNSERIRVTDGESLGDIYDPYFRRSQARFSGHLHTPNQPTPSGFALGSQKGGVTFVALPVFTAYRTTGAVALLEIAANIIRKALGGPKTLDTSLPRAGRALLRHQPRQSRYVLHLLHATPLLRGNIQGSEIQPIQDLTEIRDIEMQVRVGQPVRAVRSVPDGAGIAFETVHGGIAFTVDRLKGARVIALEY